MTDKLFILACGYFVRDVKAALALIEDDKDIEVISFAPDCGQPPLTWEHINELTASAGEGSEILVLGSICIAAANADAEAKQDRPVRKRTLYFDQCFDIIAPPEMVHDAMARGSYLLSPGWLAGWQKQVKEWGFSKEGTQHFLNESVNKLLFLDTRVDEHSGEQIRDFAEYTKQIYEVLPVGLDYLRAILEREIVGWRERVLEKKNNELRKQAVDNSMSLDLLARLSRTASEVEVIDGLFDLFAILFAPAELVFIPYLDGKAGKARVPGHMAVEAVEDLPEFSGGYAWCEGDRGFWLRLEQRGELLGVLKVNQIAMPQYRDAYLNQALNITSVCALVIDNARIQQKLLDTAHMAGKAELAIEVLHNAGNVLNSINVSSLAIMEKLRLSVGKRLAAVVSLMDEHRNDLAHFLIDDPRGAKLPAFFSLLSEELEKERNALLEEANRLATNIEHVKRIIRTQQVYSSESGLLEHLMLDDLLDEVVQLYASLLQDNRIVVEKHFADLGIVEADKHKLLQILGNLMSNAIDSLVSQEGQARQIILRILKEDVHVVILVEDNGVGISADNLHRIFNHGFTTKQGHSGYGLHSAANQAGEIGGKLTAMSEGEGQGACFRLAFPLRVRNEEQQDGS